MKKKKTIKKAVLLLSLTGVIAFSTACTKETEKSDPAPLENKGIRSMTDKTTQKEIPTQMTEKDKVENNTEREEVDPAHKIKAKVTLKEGYTFNEVEGSYLLEYVNDKTVFAKVEILDGEINVEEEAKAIMSDVSKWGGSTNFTPALKVEDFPEFFENAETYIFVQNDIKDQKIVLKKIDNNYVKFIINREITSEDVTPVMMDILNTLILTK